MSTSLAAWHKAISTKDVSSLDKLLADTAVFHSPVVHSPQIGKELTKMYLSAAFHVLANDSFHYVREVIDGQNAVLEFEVEVDGVIVNGVDMIRWDDSGKIADFKVMLRPYKAINLIKDKMRTMLESH